MVELLWWDSTMSLVKSGSPLINSKVTMVHFKIWISRHSTPIYWQLHQQTRLWDFGKCQMNICQETSKNARLSCMDTPRKSCLCNGIQALKWHSPLQANREESAFGMCRWRRLCLIIKEINIFHGVCHGIMMVLSFHCLLKRESFILLIQDKKHLWLSKMLTWVPKHSV